MNRTNRKGSRAALIAALNEAGRVHSTATVLFHEAMAERFGLTATDTKTIDVLTRLGPLPAGDLVSHTGLTSSSVTALIDRLERKGLVRRVADASDRRKVIIELVPEGFAKMSAAYEEFGASLRDLWDRYTISELRIILDFLERAAAHVRSQTM